MLNHCIVFLVCVKYNNKVSYKSLIFCMDLQLYKLNVATAKKVYEEGTALASAVPSFLRSAWIMWWGSPWGAGDFTTGPHGTCAGRLFRAQSPVDLFSRAKPAATARGLEVSISRSGPPQPTDSEQQGQLWGCRTPLLGKALKQKHINNTNMTRRWEKKNRKTLSRGLWLLQAWETGWDFI